MTDEPTPTLTEQLLQNEGDDLSERNGDNDSLLGQLAAKRKEISQIKETFVPVPGYDREPPLLLPRYRLLEGPELAKIAGKVRRETKNEWTRGLMAAADTLLEAIVGFYVDLGDGNPQPLTYKGEHILGYTMALAEAMQFADSLPQPITARSIVFGLFANNDVSLSQHNYMLNVWFGDTSVLVSRELLTPGNL